jgi:hypothetical protein
MTEDWQGAKRTGIHKFHRRCLQIFIFKRDWPSRTDFNIVRAFELT